MTDHSPNEQFQASSFMDGANADYIDQLQARHAADPASVDQQWAEFFAALGENDQDAKRAAEGPSWARADWPPIPVDDLTAALTGEWPVAAPAKDAKAAGGKIAAKAAEVGAVVSDAQVQRAVLDSIRAIMLIRAYRIRGHLAADLDPLGMKDNTNHPELDPKSYGFSDADMDRPIFIDNVLGLQVASIRQILELVKRTYCGTFALQYMHISDPEQSAWLKERIEGYGKEIAFTREGRRAILNKLVEAEGFEKFLHVKYMGTKRFGLDGGESLIPAMEQIIKRGGQLGVKDVVVGMPHRGRLSVLANVMQKPYRAIFNEFQGGSFKPDDVDGSGDVKYHLGASSDRSFDGNTVHLSLTANPSHLEAVNPVVLGKVRAKQDQLNDQETRSAVLPILLHGDAAFAGQGVVAECFQLSGIRGHRTGGTMHIVVNNQIGFTTAPSFSRTSPYCTDIALMVEAPIFHVNGDDPEAVVHAARVATEYRQKFHKDVVLDIICYRRFGHNEGDEPMFTNPAMYQKIRKQKTTLQLYTERLVKDGLIPEGEIEDMKAAFQSRLNDEFEAGKDYKPNKADWLDGRWKHLAREGEDYQAGQTAISEDTMADVGAALTRVPDGFEIHKTVGRLIEAKKKMFETGQGFDWATAEALAFGSLTAEGFPVRLSGQDSTRGTFSQRHSAFVNQETEERHYPLNHIRQGQARYEVIDTMLSEYAVLGFEYGYSLAEPNALVMWEAQFGDFANGAQIMFDQFINSGESKWLRMSGLTMLLPHGYEGQGPEHSSARLERFLQMSANDNWIVANCSTPANYFHILRRQMHRTFRKPLVLMTPKSLLRHPMCVSGASDFTDGSTFHRVLWDDAQKGHSETKLRDDEGIKRVVICSGKVYFDLLAERDKRGLDDVYLLRLEQFYPFPALTLVRELGRFKDAEIVWCQEEPKNQGGWSFVEPNLEWVLTRIGAKHSRAVYAGRAASASPATGLASRHKAEQEALVNDALTVGADMATEVRVPTLGESVSEATVATWFKKVGDTVAQDEMLCELETDKVTVEVPAPAAGTLTEIVVAEGETVGVNALLAQIGEGGAKPAAPAKKEESGNKAGAGESKMVDVMVPALGESVSEATVATWFKKPGDTVAQDEMLCELETDKVSVEVPSPAAGVLGEIIAKEGDTVPAGAKLAVIQQGEGGSVAAPQQEAKESPKSDAPKNEAPAGTAGKDVEDAPSAKKAMAEAGVNRDQVQGSGRDGRVMKEDVLKAMNAPKAAAPAAPAAPRGPVSADDASREERVKMTRLRQTIARRLKEAQNSAAMLTTYNEVDMSAIMALRNEYKDQFEKKHKVKLGFMSFFVKACVHALKEVPDVNAEIDGTDVVYKNYVHMGVAVGTPTGLVVPVVRDADQMGFAAIEKKISELGLRARDGKLSMAEMQGGSFTISNGGVYGSLMSSPILNPPQSGILGMHKIQERPVVVNGQIVIRPMMYLALSYDHRIVDGKGAVTFLVRVKEALEDPRRLLMDL